MERKIEWKLAAYLMDNGHRPLDPCALAELLAASCLLSDDYQVLNDCWLVGSVWVCHDFESSRRVAQILNREYQSGAV